MFSGREDSKLVIFENFYATGESHLLEGKFQVGLVSSEPPKQQMMRQSGGSAPHSVGDWVNEATKDTAALPAGGLCL